MWSQSKIEALNERMGRLGIRESDFEESFILGSGKGGQKINKSASTVQIRHRPTGITVKCSQRRAQAENRLIARRILCEKIEEIDHKRKSATAQKAAKIRKQKQRRSRRAQTKILGDKRVHGEKKRLRLRPQDEET